MASEELQHALQRVSGTTLDVAGAANVWAGSVSTTLVSQRTNLCTNPNFETNLTGWIGNAATQTRDTVIFHSGVASAKAVCDGTSGYQGHQAANMFSVVAGLTYTMSAWVFSTVATTIRIGMYSNVIGGTPEIAIAANVWTRLSRTGVANATALVPYTIVDTGSVPVATTLYIDDVLIELSSTLNPYFDGATPPALLVTYAWTGTANASTSTRSIWTPGGLELVGALNKKAGTVGLDIDGVCNVLAGTPGQGKGINACAGLFV